MGVKFDKHLTKYIDLYLYFKNKNIFLIIYPCKPINHLLYSNLRTSRKYIDRISLHWILNTNKGYVEHF